MAPTPPVESERGAARLADALADPGATVAVVGDPFAGRVQVLDDAAATLDAPARVRLAPDDATPAPDDRPLVVDDCHHLYARRIGGFDPLDAFLDRLTEDSTRVVTSWNRHSWNYLDAVRDLSAAFEHVFRVPPLSGDGLAAEIRAATDSLPAFAPPPGRRNSPVTTAAFSVPVPGRNPVSLRVPTLDRDYVGAWLRDRDRPSAEELVFERLERLSRGNPGVAAAIWEACIEGTTVTPSDLALPVEMSADPSDDAVAVLGVVVAKGAATREELAAVVPDAPLDRTLRVLADWGFVTADDVVRLRPGGLPSALASLERRRWLW